MGSDNCFVRRRPELAADYIFTDAGLYNKKFPLDENPEDQNILTVLHSSALRILQDHSQIGIFRAENFISCLACKPAFVRPKAAFKSQAAT